jgi:preprotein translocase subunit YajC
MLLLPYNFLALIEVPATAAEGSQPSMLFPMLAMGAIFYFVLIAPERKQRKSRQAMLDQVQKGDKIVTTGGIFGTVRKVEENKVHIMVDDKVCMVFTRSSVQGVVDSDGALLGGKAAPVKEEKAKGENSKKDGESPKALQD